MTDREIRAPRSSQDAAAPPGPGPATAAGLGELAWAFLRLGCLSFGGPAAHLSFFRAEFVERRAWLDDAQYADLVALCQFLPGPASSQVAYALGMHRAGLRGAIVASLCFTLPSAALMIAFGYGVAQARALQGAGWLHGLKLSAVAVVAQAAWSMGKRLCPDRARRTLCAGSAAALLLAPNALAQVTVIAAGGLVGWWLYRDAVTAAEPGEAVSPRGHALAAMALAVWAGLLLALPAAARATGSPWLAAFDSFYRAGSLVFGGGHVVLPLLRAEVVPRGWLTDDAFLAGYGAAQAVPGPLFSFAGYIGAAMELGPRRWLSGLWCLLGVFLPAWLLIGGALPFWQRLRATRWAQAALLGANATVVGVLLAALYAPVVREGVRGPRDVALALVAFAALEWWRAPPWAVVALMALAGAAGGALVTARN